MLRLSSPEVDLSRSRGIDDRTRAQLRERLLILDADDQVAALLAMRHSLKQLEGRVAELQLKLSTLPPQVPAKPAPEPAKPAEPPVKTAEPVKAVEPPKATEPPKVAEPAKAAEPAKTIEDAKPADPPKPAEAPKPPQAAKKPAPVPTPAPEPAVDGVPLWLWGVLALALGGIAAIAGASSRVRARRRRRQLPRRPSRSRIPTSTTPRRCSEAANTGPRPPRPPNTAWWPTPTSRSPPASRAPIRAPCAAATSRNAFPRSRAARSSSTDPDSVVKAARLFYEDGALARAVELLQFAVEETPPPLKPWLALFEIFRLEGLSGEFGELAAPLPGAPRRERQLAEGPVHRPRDRSAATPSTARRPSTTSRRSAPAATRRAMPVTFDPLAENWLNAPMDFTTDALAASLRAGLLADAGMPETDLVADPMPALKNVEMFNVA